MLLSRPAKAAGICQGHFVNPLTDICWECLLPISIGPVNIGKGRRPKARDTRNPSSPVCLCTPEGQHIPVPGVTIGFWEPVRLIDVTRSPYCLVNLGGLQLSEDTKKIGGRSSGYGQGRRATDYSFYHLHYYVYPLIYWLELLSDFACLEMAEFDVAYLSEFDLSWNDPKMQQLLNPEAALFGNPLVQAACTIDCLKANIDLASDRLFWCAGCLGNLYPLCGANSEHGGGVQNSSLLATRILAKLHKMGLAEETATDDASINGKICQKNRAFRLKKSQYKLQLVNPKSSAESLGCWPLGLSDLAYSSGQEYPYGGQDWGYLLWRKRNCCLF